jgi:hypothetical protein
LFESFDAPNFYENLLTYFLTRDIRGFGATIFPDTEKRRDLMQAGVSKTSLLIQNHHEMLTTEGMSASYARAHCPEEIKSPALSINELKTDARSRGRG